MSKETYILPLPVMQLAIKARRNNYINDSIISKVAYCLNTSNGNAKRIISDGDVILRCEL